LARCLKPRLSLAETAARHFSSTNPHQPSSSVVASGNFVYPRTEKDNFHTNDHPTVVTADDNAAILDAVRDLLSASFRIMSLKLGLGSKHD
jgi:hypothetical protein